MVRLLVCKELNCKYQVIVHQFMLSQFSPVPLAFLCQPVRNQEICFTKNRLAADYFIVCKVCFQSVADALPSSSAKMFSCRRETDEKQICTRSVKSAESASRLTS